MVASVATLAPVVAKIGLHRRWIVSVARRSIFRSAAPMPTGQPVTLRPAAVVVPVGRRDFVWLMAGVSAVAVLAGANALSGSLSVQAEATDQATAQAATIATSSNSTSVAATTSSTCRVRCNRRCAHPGHCRKYVDSNKNGRCDLGECLA